MSSYRSAPWREAESDAGRAGDTIRAAGQSSVDHSVMREMNLALILNRLRQNAPISRTGLASLTGLNKGTVSSLVKELAQGGFIREVGTNSTSVGRPAITLELNPDAGYIIGAEIGVDFISVIVTNFAARTLWRRHESTLAYSSQDEILSRTGTLLREAYDQRPSHDKPVFGLGLGVPGLVDVETGTLLFAPNLKWRDVALRALLEGLLNVPVYVDNEANMAALGESYFGAAQGAEMVLYVSSGVGLGGGIILDGRLLQGAAGFAGEVGHMTMDPDGLPCNCGNVGCWETLASQWAVFRRIREQLEAGRPSRLIQAAGPNLEQLTVRMVVEAASRGDQVARTALADTAYWLGIGMANLINALNPQLVVFGGTLSLAHEYLLPVIRDVVQRRALRWSVNATEIRVAAHGADACVMGAIATVYEKILSRPSTWM